MTKLKQTDRRPKREFQIGDIVTPHPKRSDLNTIGNGIVLGIVDITGRKLESGYQELVVFWASREVDLWVETRRWARARVYAPAEKPEGMTVANTDLKWTGRNEEGWLDAPDDEELGLLRFSDLLNDLS